MVNQQIMIALAQLNPVVGDIAGNVQKIMDVAQKAVKQGADLIIFPEMIITGYPPEDLVYKSAFQQAAMAAVQQIADETKDLNSALLLGGLWAEGGAIYNAAFLVENGKVTHRQIKHDLPNYGVFDEKRVFTPGPLPEPVIWRGINLAIYICSDVWNRNTVDHFSRHDVDLQVVLNASPYEMGKASLRKEKCTYAVTQCGAPLIYVNMIGGQDELVFDGRSFAMDSQGNDAARLTAFDEEFAITQWSNGCCTNAPMVELKGDMDTVYAAMVLGLRDYVNKNGFPGVVIGLSGGIDSGLTAAVAVDALGPDRVHGILMPSPYSSDHSVEDAKQLADNFGMSYDMVPIETGMQAFDAMLGDIFAGKTPDETEENIQARLRGMVVMAYSNKFGHMVLTTGNKSEMSVGYATLYGDMCGGYSVLKDVYKTTVYRLSRWRNEQGNGEVIPPNMIEKPPSAELRPDQFDEDSLPPYDVLDDILHGLLERRASMKELVNEGFDAETVARIAKMLYIAEYKRRQSPPGVKVSGMSFGRDRRYPITNKWIWQSQL